MDIQELTVQVEGFSQRYASRFGIDRDAGWFVLKLQEEIGELTQVLILARHHEIDVVEEIRNKRLVYAADAAPPPGDGTPPA
jgi:hypothetical protein